MKEIVIALITRVLSWPVAAIVLGLIFRQRVSDLLARATHLSLKHGDTSLEARASATASEQIEQAKTPTSALLNTSLSDPPNTALALAGAIEHQTDEAKKSREAAIDFGKSIEAVRARDTVIREELARLKLPLADPLTTDVLIRNLAFNQAIAGAERLYRLIFGSQIALLRFLNTLGPKPDTEIEPFYEKAKKQFAKFYGGYSYVSWRQFLLDQKVIVPDVQTNAYVINQAGRDFLAWMASEGLTENKAG